LVVRRSGRQRQMASKCGYGEWHRRALGGARGQGVGVRHNGIEEWREDDGAH
jgi:hypothetical protein